MNELNTPLPNTFAAKAIAYYLNLQTPTILPASVEIINPYQTEAVRETVRQFYTRFFNDSQPRIFLLGINPGRLGGGTTGLSFTDPVALRNYCHIQNDFGTKTELSSRFVYEFIQQFGGAKTFYSQFYLSALYPLALVKHGKNYNFYDEPSLYQALKADIVANIQAQIGFGANIAQAVCLGKKNGVYLKRLNDEYGFFKSIVVLDHPRYIMQYKLREMEQYLDKYRQVLNDFTHC
ncbi:MAG: uracil-DNA glycosylase family protein [Bacteroidota bacterium]